MKSLIGPPSTWLLSRQFQTAEEESIYGKLYKKNMDGLNSFYDALDGLEKLVNEDSVALIAGIEILSIFVCRCKPISCIQYVFAHYILQAFLSIIQQFLGT